MAALAQQEPWQITSGLLALLQQPQRLSVTFSSILKKHECLLLKRPAGKHRYEVLPTDVALILFWLRQASVILIESVFPAVKIGSMLEKSPSSPGLIPGTAWKT
jgi:hypothetical protein